MNRTLHLLIYGYPPGATVLEVQHYRRCWWAVIAASFVLGALTQL